MPEGLRSRTPVANIAPHRQEEYRRRGYWGQPPLAARLEEHAEEAPERLAVAIDEARLSYGELNRAVGSAASWLAARELRAGDCLLIALPNGLDYVIAHLAASRAGIASVMMSAREGARDLAYALHATQAQAAIVPDHLVPALAAELEAPQAGSGAPRPAILSVLSGAQGPTHPGDQGDIWPGWRSFVQAGAQGPMHRPCADDLELVVFSSGTTGSPKGIAHTYDGANASLANWVRTLGLTWRDVVFCPATFGHVGGAQWGLRTAVHLGAPLVLQDRWNPGQAAALIAEFGCTYTLVTPTFIVDLMRLPEECRRRMGSFRYWTVGGSGMSQPFIEAAERALPGVVLRGFGMSEHFMSTVTRPDDPPVKRQTRDGRPLPGVEIQVWDEEGRPLPAGSPGEMVVRGPSSVGGYFTHPEETRATFVEGWQRTGDIVSLDEEGFIAVVDRKKEIIIRGGENISPQEIEQILGRHEDMPALVVVGIPDERLGEKVGVVVEAPPEGCTLEACARILADAHVARHKWPQVLIAVAELPRTSLGKIRRGSVRSAVRAGLVNGELPVLGRTEQ